jgi:protein phosphatase 2C family protein 2/3
MERSRGFSVRSGRIILLGDGTEVITDQNDEELFDQTEEDQDLTNQVQHESGTRNDRQATPGPQGKQENGSGTSAQISESPASTDAEKEKLAS